MTPFVSTFSYGLKEVRCNSKYKQKCKKEISLNFRENPDVVYLQEVIPQTVKIIEDSCPTYQLIPGGTEKYFTAIMLKVCFSDTVYNTIAKLQIRC